MSLLAPILTILGIGSVVVLLDVFWPKPKEPWERAYERATGTKFDWRPRP